MVEDDSAVGPAVMVDQAQVGEKTHANSLQASLITQCEGITLDLQRHVKSGGAGWKEYVWQTNNLGVFLKVPSAV